MPLDPSMSRGSMISELLHKYKGSGTIGNTKPRSMGHAQSIAAAIAYRMKRGKGRKRRHRP